MSSYVELLKKIVNKENELELYKEKVLSIPFWRLIRFSVRTQYIKQRTGFNNKSRKASINLFLIVKSYCASIIKYVVFLSRRPNVQNLIFAFPRLAKLDNLYLDKFTDPVIEYSSVKDNYIIFQRNLGGTHKHPRCHAKKVVESDAIDYTAKILGVLFSPLFFILYFRSISNIYKRARLFFQLTPRFLLNVSIKTGSFVIHYFLIRGVYKVLKPERIFLVDREIFIPAIVAAKNEGITIYEIQHGITHSETILYTGEYDRLVDPDYFLVFGEKWIGPQFTIPLNKIINIGWAYKLMINRLTKAKPFGENYVLVISSPSITTVLYNVVFELAKYFPNIIFRVRLHPQESLTETQLKSINNIENIELDDDLVDSAIAVGLYSKIIGENSSVLYEALSAGKSVGRLNMGGLTPKNINGKPMEGFYYINDKNDFEAFMKACSSEMNDKVGRNSIYGDFDSEAVNNILKK